MIAVYRVQQLKDADDIINGILHRNCEEGFGSVARSFVELPGSGKIEVLRIVGIGDVDGFPRQGCGTSNIGPVFLARFRINEAHRGKRNFLARGSAHGDLERIRAHDFEFQAVVLGLQVKRSAVRVGEILGFKEDSLHQAVGVLFRRERDADLDQPLETRGLTFIGRFFAFFGIVHSPGRGLESRTPRGFHTGIRLP